MTMTETNDVLVADCGCHLTGLAADYGRHTSLLIGHEPTCPKLLALPTHQPPALCRCWHSMGWNCQARKEHYPAKAPDCATGDNYSHNWRADGRGGSRCEICGIQRPAYTGSLKLVPDIETEME